MHGLNSSTSSRCGSILGVMAGLAEVTARSVALALWHSHEPVGHDGKLDLHVVQHNFAVQDCTWSHCGLNALQACTESLMGLFALKSMNELQKLIIVSVA